MTNNSVIFIFLYPSFGIIIISHCIVIGHVLGIIQSVCFGNLTYFLKNQLMSSKEHRPFSPSMSVYFEQVPFFTLNLIN
ncbi:unnamed protein product, partial [Callosobruchus maculatus]